MKRILTLLLLITVSITLTSCTKEDEGPTRNPEITIEVEGHGTMVIELYYDVAPNTVLNFIKNVEDGVYTDNSFHRIISDFMIQGGRSSSQCVIEAEANNNPSYEGTNDLSHVRGVISMARTSVFNSATSQFFIVHEDSVFLDGNYTAFGMLLEGFNVLDSIAGVYTNTADAPVITVVIESITVDTFGYDYPDPECE